MLTSDLLRARRRGDEIEPIYLEPTWPDHLALAEKLVALFGQHVSKTHGQLDSALTDLVGEKTDYLLYRGLAKLLLDRCHFEIDSPIEPSELRKRIFERAAQHHPVARAAGDRVHTVTREQMFVELAAELKMEPAQLDKAFYADLEDELVLRKLEPITPLGLLHRYNVALAQAVLLRASSLTLTIAPGDPKRYRQLFRYIKFYGLMHTVRGDRERGYQVHLDGPTSLFQLSSKYGVKLADFLPALLLCDGWTLEAKVLWGRDRKAAHFYLSSQSGLVSHYPDHGVYVTEEERYFVERFEALESEWMLERKPEVIDLGGQGVLIPDFVLRHKKDGREALLEIVGFWRKGYLESRMALLKERGPRNLILAVSKRLRGSAEELEKLPGSGFFFKDVILTREVLERADKIAERPKGQA